MVERRQEERTPIKRAVEVEDEYFNEKIGTLIDISPKGLRIQGDVQLEINDDLKLKLLLPDQILGTRTIRVTAECVWCRSVPESDDWQSGFEFTKVSEKDSSAIIGLIIQSKQPE